VKDAEIVDRHFANPEVLLGFMRRTRKPVFHKSNIFFRDIQYAIKDYFDTVERESVSIPEAERLAMEVVERYTLSGLLRKVNNQAYLLDMPSFKTPQDGTYTMLTIHGAPLSSEAEAAVDIATMGTAADPEFQGNALKGGDVSPDGAKLAELTPSAAISGAPQEPHTDPQEATTNKPNPKVERHFK
jgi:hypothetical protein